MSRSKNTWSNPRSLKVAMAVFFVTMFIGMLAKAETVYLADTPSNKVSDEEALKTVASGKTVWKCEFVKSGPNLNPVKVPNTKATWHVVDTLQGLENPFERLAAREKTVRCSEMEANTTNGRIKKAS